MTTLVALGDVVVRATGTRNPAASPSAGFSYVDVAAIDNVRKAITGARRLVGIDAPSRARKVIRAGDVLVSTVRPNLNAIALVPPELDSEIASTGFCVLRATQYVLPEYLFFYVQSNGFIESLNRLVAGAMYPAVTDAQVLSQIIPLPDLKEQGQVVDLLSRAEGIVRLRREAQKKAAEIIPALFLDMFGDPATNPKGWPVTYLGELIHSGPTNGLYKHKSAYGRGTPILRIDAFYDGKVEDLSSLKRVELGDDERLRFALRPGDIVINRVNSPEYLGKSAIIPDLLEQTVYESNMMRFAVDTRRVRPDFMIALLQQRSSRQHFLAHAKHAINQSSINQQDVRSLPVIVPPLHVQARFDQLCRSELGIVTQQDAASRRAEATFHSLLARAFIGELTAPASAMKEAAVA